MSTQKDTAPQARRRRLLQLLGLLLAGFTLWFSFRGVDLVEVAELVRRVGPASALILLPFLLAMGLDSLAWREQFSHLGRRLQLSSLLGVRLCSEAVLLAVSGGPIVSEGVAPVLLNRRWRVPVSETVATLGMRKALLLVSQAFYVGLGAIAGFSFLQQHSAAMIRTENLGWLMIAGAGVLFLLSLALTTTLVQGGVAELLYRLARRVPIRRLHAALEDLKSGALDTDQKLGLALGATPADGLKLISLYLIAWLVESFETYLILRLLGVEVSFAVVWAVEPALSLIRHVFFFVPAGLGVQDAGYLLFLKTLGVHDPIALGSAFVVLKRSKELIWSVFGFLLLSRLSRLPPPITAAEANVRQVKARASKKRVLLICGSINQTTQMLQIGRHLKDCETWYTPFYTTGLLYWLQRWGLAEMTIAGNKLARRSLDHLKEEGVNIDFRGEQGGYDMVLMPTDQIVQGNWGKAKRVLVQEGMLDPVNFMFHINKLLPIFPRWLVSTSATGLSYDYDRFCVASPGYRDYFIKHGVDPDRIRVTGMPNFDACSDYYENDFPHRGYFLVCTSDARETYKFDNRKKFIELAVARAKGRQIIFKLHPNERVDRATAEIARWAPGALVYASGSAEEMVANAAAVMCQWSSLAYVAMALNKELYSYFDLEELRRLCPVQNHESAELIAQICLRELQLHDGDEMGAQAQLGSGGFRPASAAR